MTISAGGTSSAAPSLAALARSSPQERPLAAHQSASRTISGSSSPLTMRVKTSSAAQAHAAASQRQARASRPVGPRSLSGRRKLSRARNNALKNSAW
jgi:hypothetical protein